MELNLVNPEKTTDIFGKIAEGLNTRADLKSYIEHPDKYLKLFGKPWSKQVDIITSVRDNKITLVRSSNDVGKTWTAAAIVLWWLDVYRPKAKVISTAKTFDSVRFMLWTRIRQMYKSVAYRFNDANINFTDFQPDPRGNPDWFAIGYNPRIEADEATAFQGHHSENILFLVDEAITTHPAIWKAIEGSLLSKGARLLAIYNPTTREGEVFKMEQDKRGHLITISNYDLFESKEYLKDPDYFNELADPGAVEELIETYGEDSPIVKARVFGEWADESDECAISYNSTVKATKVKLKEPEPEKIVYSWDVAGEGTDLNVLGKLYGSEETLIYDEIKKWKAKHSDSLAIVQEIIYEDFVKTPEADIHLIVDAVGEGSHVPSMMTAWLTDLTVRPFKAGMKAGSIPERPEVQLMNAISEAWYRSSLVIEKRVEHFPEIQLNISEQTIHEITTRKKNWSVKNKEPLVWFIEPKDLYKSRNRGGSPDSADALVMAIWGYFKSQGVRMFSL